MTSNCHDCGELKLSNCDVSRCEAMCCYDGAYLEQQEETFLEELVARVPELKAHLPAQFIVDGFWKGENLGRKTATRPHAYANPAFPAHFTKTRCVFADDIGYCTLEKFARARGQHPWTFKPSVCWLFPLHEEDKVPEPPPREPKQDPHRQRGYPGYVTVVPCGRHDEAGAPWQQALGGELDYLRAAPRIPLLGSPGHTVDALLNGTASG